MAGHSIRLNVNGRTHVVDTAPGEPLLYVLRDRLQLGGPKFGCGLAQCGACTVTLDGKAIRSCVTPAAAAAGERTIVTVEGLGTADHPGPLQRAFIAEQAAQCGYCLPGMIMTASALLDATPHLTDTQIRGALNGNLCRCGTHLRILRAVKRAASERT